MIFIKMQNQSNDQRFKEYVFQKKIVEIGFFLYRSKRCGNTFSPHVNICIDVRMGDACACTHTYLYRVHCRYRFRQFFGYLLVLLRKGCLKNLDPECERSWRASYACARTFVFHMDVHECTCIHVHIDKRKGKKKRRRRRREKKKDTTTRVFYLALVDRI